MTRADVRANRFQIDSRVELSLYLLPLTVYTYETLSIYGCQYTAMTRGQIFCIIIMYTFVVFIFVSTILLVLAWNMWSYNAIDTDYYYLTHAGRQRWFSKEGRRFPAPDRLNIDVKIIWIWIIEWWLWPLMDEIYKRKLRYNIRVYYIYIICSIIFLTIMIVRR